MQTNNLVVTEVNLFSVRSCAGQSLQEAAVTPHGLSFDRQWRLIGADGKFLTQRECPRMALVLPSVVSGKLQLRFAGTPDQAPQAHENSTAVVDVYEHWKGIDQGDEIASWLTSHLGMEARLLRITRDQSEDFARPDMSPILVISEESLADLNGRLAEPVPMNRFRPNIVVRGGRPYEEDSWTRITIGDVVYVAHTEPCGRCSMINIDQEKGEKAGKEPLKTLATYRRTPGAVLFGKYMVALTSGTVRVGDAITGENNG